MHQCSMYRAAIILRWYAMVQDQRTMTFQQAMPIQTCVTHPATSLWTGGVTSRSEKIWPSLNSPTRRLHSGRSSRYVQEHQSLTSVRAEFISPNKLTRYHFQMASWCSMTHPLTASKIQSAQVQVLHCRNDCKLQATWCTFSSLLLRLSLN